MTGSETRYYDVAVAGGGLAGLATAIQLAREGYRVALFEKEKYPFHKVCGEYISMESRDFLGDMGIPVREMGLPEIDRFLLTTVDGRALHHQLPLGGFGVSRFSIDNSLAIVARAAGVDVYDDTKVQDIVSGDDSTTLVTDNYTVNCRVCCGSFGKRSNIDVKWKRDFLGKRGESLNNFIAVKYHARINHSRNTVALHLFRNGYCGVSPVENDVTCICYLTTAANLKRSGGNISKMEEEILFANPHIREVLRGSELLYDQPLAIAQISFERKAQVENHVLMVGDAAGLITPLCGNGMSMALLGSRIAAKHIDNYLSDRIPRHQMESNYREEWNRQFSKRLRAGRIIQWAFGNEWLTGTLVSSLRHFPGLFRSIVRQTHGT